MNNKLIIRNFKSIKDLTFSCQKLNIFIGEPNSGKSNIIEALSLQSQNAVMQNVNHEMFRYKSIGDLFYDFNINNPIEVITNDKHTILEYAMREDGSPDNQFHFRLDAKIKTDQPDLISHEGIRTLTSPVSRFTNVHLYEY